MAEWPEESEPEKSPAQSAWPPSWYKETTRVREDEQVCPRASQPNAALPSKRCTIQHTNVIIFTGSSARKSGDTAPWPWFLRTKEPEQQEVMEQQGRRLTHQRQTSPSDGKFSKRFERSAFAQFPFVAFLFRKPMGKRVHLASPPSKIESCTC